jgi:hypothetical protein
MYKTTSQDGKRVPKGAKEFITYDWTKGGKQGVVAFSRPDIYGLYLFQCFTSTPTGGWKCVGMSQPVHVGPKVTLTTTILTDVKTMPVRVRVTATQTSAALADFPPNAWIGLYQDKDEAVPDADFNRRYTIFQWMSTSKASRQDDVKNDEKILHTVSKDLEFDIPKSGKWQFRFFPSKTYEACATCTVNLNGENTLRISTDGPLMTVHCSISTVDPTTDYVWVGVYRVEEQNMRQYRRYKYLLTSGPSSFCCKTPIHTGTYEARLFAHQSYDVLAKSNSLSLQGI